MDNISSIRFMRWVHEGIERVLALVLLTALIASAPQWMPRLTLATLHGEWADKALSDVLTEKYGHPVTVQNAQIQGWSDISFDSLEVRAENGQVMIHSSQGCLHLKNFNFFKKTPFETELCLHQVVFFNEYYKNSSIFKPWNRILKKPFEIDELVLHVLQSEEKTVVRILKSDSKDVIVNGGISIDAGGFHDALHVKFSPWMMLRAFF